MASSTVVVSCRWDVFTDGSLQHR